MPELVLDDVTIAYEVAGEGEPIVLIAGLGEPAVTWHVTLAPHLTAAGYQVVTFDNRGVAPSSAPPAPYTIEQMAADTAALVDHLGAGPVRVVGYSMGGWIAETLAVVAPDRVRAAVLMGSCNESTAWERVSLRVARDLAATGVALPAGFDAVELLRYLSRAEVQDDAVVDDWVALLGDETWGNPGRLGQYEAGVRWTLDDTRPARWAAISVPVLVLAFEHDIDSPPARAAEAAARIDGAQFAAIAGAGHMAPITHTAQVAAELLDFFARA